VASKKSKKTTIRERLHRAFQPYGSQEGSSRASLYVDIFVLVSIMLSCALVPLEYALPVYADFFFRIEVAFAMLFLTEYLLRWYAAEDRWRYPFTFLAMIDLLAILPTLLMLSSQAMALRLVRWLRTLRLLRLIRLLRLLRYGFWVHRGIVSLRIRYSALDQQYRLHQLGRLLGWLLLAWLIGANVLYVTESALADRPGPFSDYWNSYWHVVIALVSGIEDKEPVTLLGRIEMTLLLISGILAVGMFTGEIVNILVKKSQRADMLALKPPRGRFEHHILIIGINAHLENVIRQVAAAYQRRPFFVVAGQQADSIRVKEPALYRKVYALVGDPVDARVLEMADLETASRVIVLASNSSQLTKTASDGYVNSTSMEPPTAQDAVERLDSRTLMKILAVVAGRSKPVPIVAELLSEDSLNYAAPLQGVDLFVSRPYGEKLLGQAVINPGITNVYDELMTFTDDSNEFYTVLAPDELHGKSFQKAQLYFLDMDKEDMVLVGIDRSPREAPNTRFWLAPCPDYEELVECSRGLSTNVKAPSLSKSVQARSLSRSVQARSLSRSVQARSLSEEQRVIQQGDQLVLIAFERPSFAAVSKEERWSGKILERNS
jgi:voltage-gated potassium channel